MSIFFHWVMTIISQSTDVWIVPVICSVQSLGYLCSLISESVSTSANQWGMLCANFMVQQFYDKITNLCYHHLSGAFKRHFLQETTQIKFQTKPSTVTMENVYLICYLNFKGIFKWFFLSECGLNTLSFMVYDHCFLFGHLSAILCKKNIWHWQKRGTY